MPTDKEAALSESRPAESPSESAPAPEGATREKIAEEIYDLFGMVTQMHPADGRDKAYSKSDREELLKILAKLPAPEGMGRDADVHDRKTLAKRYAHEYAFNLHPNESALAALFLKFANDCTSRFLAHPTSESGTKSCLMCGQIGDKAIVHEPSGVYICMNCRAKAESGRVEEQWIAVESKLPPRHQNVLCLNRDGNIFEGRICAGMHKPFFTYPRGDGNPSNTAPSWIDVTHWMSLPKVPASQSQPSVKEK